jgi:hypothetical protein
LLAAMREVISISRSIQLWLTPIPGPSIDGPSASL